MWAWIVVGGVLLFLLARSLSDSLDATPSRPMAFMATLLDGMALVSMLLGVFGALMALVLGVFATSGPRLLGHGVTDMLIWSGALMIGSILFLVAASAVRSMGGRAPAGRAAASRGGH
jgi:hypothetical protein